MAFIFDDIVGILGLGVEAFKLVKSAISKHLQKNKENLNSVSTEQNIENVNTTGVIAEKDGRFGFVDANKQTSEGNINDAEKAMQGFKNMPTLINWLERAKELVAEKAMAAKDFVVDKATAVKDFIGEKVGAATDFVAGKAGQIAGQSVGQMVVPPTPQLAEEAGVTL